MVASGIRLGKWYKEALQFLESDFQSKNIALFVSAMYQGENPKTYPTAVERFLEGVSKEYLSVTPITQEVFGGRMKFAGKVTQDNRDINRITAWSKSLGEKINSQQLQNPAGPREQGNSPNTCRNLERSEYPETIKPQRDVEFKTKSRIFEVRILRVIK